MFGKSQPQNFVPVTSRGISGLQNLAFVIFHHICNFGGFRGGMDADSVILLNDAVVSGQRDRNEAAGNRDRFVR